MLLGLGLGFLLSLLESWFWFDRKLGNKKSGDLFFIWFGLGFWVLVEISWVFLDLKSGVFGWCVLKRDGWVK